MHDFSDFPSETLYNISTQQRQSVLPCKLSEQNLENFTTRNRFCKTVQKLLYKIPGLVTSGRHNSTMITKAKNSWLNGPPTGCIVSIFTVRINSKSFLWVVGCAPEAHPPNVFVILITYLWHSNHYWLLSHVTLCLGLPPGILVCSKLNSLFHMCGRWNKTQTRMLAINVSIPNLKIARLVQFWPWQFDVWTTNMNAHTWLTDNAAQSVVHLC